LLICLTSVVGIDARTIRLRGEALMRPFILAAISCALCISSALHADVSAAQPNAKRLVRLYKPVTSWESMS
jgi:hypothetical protein